MTEIKPATDEDIVRIEQDIDIGWTINPRSVRSLIARIHQERENTIRECAEVAQVEVDDDSCGACLTAKRIHLAILAISTGDQS